MVVRPSWVNLLESLQQGSIVVHLVEGLGVVHVEMNHAVNDEERSMAVQKCGVFAFSSWPQG